MTDINENYTKARTMFAEGVSVSAIARALKVDTIRIREYVRTQHRHCSECNAPLPLEARRDKRYCTPCGNARIASGSKKGGAFKVEDTELACKNHLRALLRYGWRHNGLPGLTAPAFFALADEMGVVA